MRALPGPPRTSPASGTPSFPFHPKQIAAVLVSHAHIDHCGNLPSLIRHGFAGPIYCTPATRDLLAVMLADSAKIQEEDAAHLNIQRNYAEPFVEPLYTRADVDRVLNQVVPIDYDKFREVRRGRAVQVPRSRARPRVGDGPRRPSTTGPAANTR